MGIQIHSSVGSRLGGRADRHAGRRKGLMSEINVTPFVDVMLVLLVIFMVTAPLLTSGVQVDLPEADAPPLTSDDEPLSVSVKADGSVYLQETKIALEELGPKLKAVTAAKQREQTNIFINGDKGVDYGRIMQVITAINQAGFGKVGLLAELPEESKK